ncbi:MAG: dicarboxylate/amino acid:cation symporter [Dysgonamonadaceae bacterium]|jgi:Na+/H+-dicarboxylate symporter|nr:dicarboxylate/amino acid:cation symporter [Dysgonamonadaceae bacterium]
MIKKIFSSLPFRLVLALFVGISGGLIANAGVMQVIVTVQNLLNAIIMFTIPLIIIGFIAPSITQLGSNASRLLGIALLLAYLSSVGASFFSVVSGYAILPHLNIVSDAGEGRALPEVIFDLQIPPIMSVMSALVFSVLIGIAATWRRAGKVIAALDEFQGMVILIVTRIIIPVLPFFIACTFCSLAYEGLITRQLPVFLAVILLVIAVHYIWMALLYSLAAVYSKKNPLRVLRHYGPAYLTAVGTMSSAATLPVALECARKSDILRRDMIDFGIPLFANIHLCGSVLTETFFVMTVSLTLYGSLPSLSSLVLFSILLGIFAIGAPGVPGGTVMASLGLIVSVLGFDATGTALMLTIFALQDSFGTACNVTSDGALTLILSEYRNRIEN